MLALLVVDADSADTSEASISDDTAPSHDKWGLHAFNNVRVHYLLFSQHVVSKLRLVRTGEWLSFCIFKALDTWTWPMFFTNCFEGKCVSGVGSRNIFSFFSRANVKVHKLKQYVCKTIWSSSPKIKSMVQLELQYFVYFSVWFLVLEIGMYKHLAKKVLTPLASTRCGDEKQKLFLFIWGFEWWCCMT